ncbi:MAG TPA: AAA family ATPase, partial [Candidatus Baltobacteraceae bacterium]|nr:AAA family ATPase [Candidatus Baltobacteraceae bacterium]
MISPAAFSDGFVGRQEELEQLSDAFRNACDSRSRFVAVEGEAGIGKSRLVREFAARLGDIASVAIGGCVEQIRRPYLPVEQVLERLGRRPRLPAAYDGRTHAEERAAYFQGVAEALEREATRKPLAIIIEDVQWADDATVDLLRYLTTAIEEARVLVILTLRNPTMLANPALASLRLSLLRVRGSSIALRGLRRYDVRNLIAKLVRDRAPELPLQAIAKIESLCDGNPLFAEELTRIAIDSGEIVLGTSAPLSAHAMLSERLATFSEDERSVLVRAAIVGQHFDAGFVAEIAGTTTDRVLATMQRALDHELVVADRVHPHRFAFRHSLIRQVLAERLVLGLAAPLHLRIARGIENGQQASKRAAELAYHYSEARVADKARYYNELAAQAAWDVHAYRDAIHFYSAALQWEYPPGLARAAIYERLGTLLYIEGVGEEPARWFERARTEYEQIEDEIGYCQALLMIADQRWVDARTSEGAQAAQEAAVRLERLGETRPWLSATLSVARYAVTLGDVDRAAELLGEIGRWQAHFDAPLNIEFYEVRAETRAALGHSKSALADGARAVELARETGSSELVAQVENNVALVAADLGELELAAEHHRTALAEARRTGLLWRVAYCALNYAQTLAWSGELTRAR